MAITFTTAHASSRGAATREARAVQETRQAPPHLPPPGPGGGMRKRTRLALGDLVFSRVKSCVRFYGSLHSTV